MSFQLTFDHRLEYDAGQAGITLAVMLRLSQDAVGCEAKVDTGATFSIFARKVGEDLGWKSKYEGLFYLHRYSDS